MSPCWTVNVNAKPKWIKHASVAVRSTIYFFSSYYINEDNLTTPIGLLDVQAFETDTYQWSVLADKNFSQINEILPRKLTWQSAVVYDEKVYLFADINEQKNVLFCFDTNSHLWAKPIVSGMVPAICHFRHSTCVIKDSIFIFGDVDTRNSGRDYCQGVYKLDLKSMKWSYVPTTGTPVLHRGRHSATAIDDRMYVFGGFGYDDDVIYLDTQTMNWVKPKVVGYRPVCRIAHSAVCYKGQLLIFGGFDVNKGLMLAKSENDLIRYEPDFCRWSPVETIGNGPCQRSQQSCFLIRDRVFLLGGLPTPWSRLKPRYFNDILALDFAPSLKTMAIVAVLEHKLDLKGLYLRPSKLILNSSTLKRSSQGTMRNSGDLYWQRSTLFAYH